MSIVDSTFSIDESNEDNNENQISLFISSPSDENNKDTSFIISESMIMIFSFVIILIGLLVMQLAPGKIKKPFEKRK